MKVQIAQHRRETGDLGALEISAIADDTIKFARVVWCAAHPDEVPFALHQFMRRRDKHSSETS
jgi:hypothetical protein